MNFDIKDVKSWSNRHDVHTLSDAGFFGNSLSEIDDEIKRYNNGEKDRLHELYQISDNGCYCFGYALYFADTGAFAGTNNSAFFLPLDAVKEDKSKKKYRPFRTIAEVDALLAKDTVKHYCFVGSDLYLRYKAKPNITKHIEITNLEVDTNTNELRFINGFTTNHLFKNFDIKIAGRWLSFGVEVEND